MIVRISGEDQYRLDDGDARTAASSSRTAVAGIVEGGEEDGFRRGLARCSSSSARTASASATTSSSAPT